MANLKVSEEAGEHMEMALSVAKTLYVDAIDALEGFIGYVRIEPNGADLVTEEQLKTADLSRTVGVLRIQHISIDAVHYLLCEQFNLNEIRAAWLARLDSNEGWLDTEALTPGIREIFVKRKFEFNAYVAGNASRINFGQPKKTNGVLN
jgi:hypothetical protein